MSLVSRSAKSPSRGAASPAWGCSSPAPAPSPSVPPLPGGVPRHAGMPSISTEPKLFIVLSPSCPPEPGPRAELTCPAWPWGAASPPGRRAPRPRGACSGAGWKGAGGSAAPVSPRPHGDERGGTGHVPAVAEEPASEGAVRGHLLHDAGCQQAQHHLHPQHRLRRGPAGVNPGTRRWAGGPPPACSAGAVCFPQPLSLLWDTPNMQPPRTAWARTPGGRPPRGHAGHAHLAVHPPAVPPPGDSLSSTLRACPPPGRAPPAPAHHAGVSPKAAAGSLPAALPLIGSFSTNRKADPGGGGGPSAAAGSAGAASWEPRGRGFEPRQRLRARV